MTVAAFLLVYSLAVIAFGPPFLRRLTRKGDAPRYGVAAWLTAIGSVLITWVLAAVLVVGDVVSPAGHHDGFLASCFAMLCDVAIGHAGRAPQIVLWLTALSGALGFVVAIFRFARTVARLRTRAHEHADAIRLVGRPGEQSGVFVVDAPERAAYCVSGRPPVIVVTTGALAALDERQLGAVLAHERAHLAGHHHLVIAAVRGLAAVFPRLPLMARGAVEVSRLLEMCADDAAVRRFGHRTLLSGLMTLAGAAPVAALGAADVAVLTRAERLAVPAAQPTRIRARAALTSASTLMVCGPLITLAVAASGAVICG